MATLGSELKQHRETQGITLVQISESTKIGLHFLQAIEEDNYKLLPGGLFTRSFVRAYANAVGLNEEHVLKTYQQQTGTAEPLSDVILGTVPTYHVENTEINHNKYIIRIIAILIISLILIGVIYTYVSRMSSRKASNTKTISTKLQ